MESIHPRKCDASRHNLMQNGIGTAIRESLGGVIPSPEDIQSHGFPHPQFPIGLLKVVDIVIEEELCDHLVIVIQPLNDPFIFELISRSQSFIVDPGVTPTPIEPDATAELI